MIPLRYRTAFKKAFSDGEVFSRFASELKRRNTHSRTPSVGSSVGKPSTTTAARDAVVERGRRMLVMLARAAGLPLDEAALARIDACDDGPTLERWTLRVPTAKSADELFEG